MVVLRFHSEVEQYDCTVEVGAVTRIPAHGPLGDDSVVTTGVARTIGECGEFCRVFL